MKRAQQIHLNTNTRKLFTTKPIEGPVVTQFRLPYEANEIGTFEGAQPLSVEIKEGHLYLNVLEDSRCRRDDLRILVVRTDQPLGPLLAGMPYAGELTFVGTVTSEGAFETTYHVFSVGRHHD